MSTSGLSPAAAMDVGNDLSASYGALLLGFVLCTVFWSFLLVQTVYYQIHYSHDAWPLRLLAFTMFAIGTTFEVLYLSGLWLTLITHFGSPTQAVAMVPSVAACVAINGCAGLVAQSFYTHRIWKFAQHRAVKWIVPTILAPLNVMAFIACIWWTHQALQLKTLLELPTIQWELYLFLVPSAVTDIAIALTLSILFLRSRTGIKSTDRVLRALVISSLNSGAWPATVATLALVLSVVLPHDLWYATMAYPIAQLYGNSVLGSLNARAALRAAGNARPSDSYMLSNRIAHNGAHGPVTPRSANPSTYVGLDEAEGDSKPGVGFHDFAVDLRRPSV